MFQTLMMNGGVDLERYLQSKSEMSIKELLTMLYPVIKGVSVLLDHGFVHQDIKKENIVVGDKDQARLIDFGTMVSFARFYFRLDKQDAEGYIINPPEYPIALAHDDSFWSFDRVGTLRDLELQTQEHTERKTFDDDAHEKSLSSLLEVAKKHVRVDGRPMRGLEEMHLKSDVYSLGIVLTYCRKMFKHGDGVTLAKFEAMRLGMLSPDPRSRWSISQVMKVVDEITGTVATVATVGGRVQWVSLTVKSLRDMASTYKIRNASTMDRSTLIAALKERRQMQQRQQSQR